MRSLEAGAGRVKHIDIVGPASVDPLVGWLQENQDVPVSAPAIEEVLKLPTLEGWAHNHVLALDNSYQMLSRPVFVDRTDIDHQQLANHRRLVGWSGDRIKVLARSFVAEDLLMIMDLNKDLGRHAMEAPDERKFLFEELSVNEQPVIKLLFKPSREIAVELNKPLSTVRNYIQSCCNKLGIKNGQELMRWAVINEMPGTAMIPLGHTNNLSEEEKLFVAQNYDYEYKETAVTEGISITQVQQLWSQIFLKTNAVDRKQLVAMATKDNLIVHDQMQFA